jgi:hemoglobin
MLPMPMDKPQAPGLAAAVNNPHYRQLGGEPAVRRLVERFYQLMAELPQAREIRALHPADLAPAKERLFLFLSGWLGGPPLYAERFGQPRLRRAHQHFPIDAKARDAWMDCMQQALAEQVSDAALLAQLKASFFKTADFLRNQ